MNRLLTHDPAGGGELVVTRLWSPATGVTIEGQFSLGWIGQLSPDQVDFVGLLLRCRNNLQRLAAELGLSYNTARSRLDEVVAAVGGKAGDEEAEAGESTDDGDRLGVLQALAAGEVTQQEALRRLRQYRQGVVRPQPH